MFVEFQLAVSNFFLTLATNLTGWTGSVDLVESSDWVAVQAFSVCLTSEQINALGGSLKATIIFEAELLAPVVSFVCGKI